MIFADIENDKVIIYGNTQSRGREMKPLDFVLTYTYTSAICVCSDLNVILVHLLKLNIKSRVSEYKSRIYTIQAGKSKFISIFNFFPNLTKAEIATATENGIIELWKLFADNINAALIELGATQTLDKFTRDKYTSIAGISYDSFVETSDIWRIMPKTTRAEYNRFYAAYRSGYVWAQRGIYRNVEQIDRRSAYPYIYGQCALPIGKATEICESELSRYDFYIVNITAVFDIKRGVFPTVCENSIVGTTQYLSSVDEYIQLTLSKPDFELFLQNYDSEYNVNWAYGWSTKKQIFQTYADTLIQKKNVSKGISRGVFKDMLNTPYGKLGTGGEFNGYEYTYNPFTDSVDKKLIGVNVSNSRLQNLPLAIAIVARERYDLIKQATVYKLDNVYYMDTDSIKGHIVPPGDNGNLGDWKNEQKADIMAIRAKKHYAQYNANAHTAKYTCAGVPKERIETLYKVTNVSEEDFLLDCNKFMSDNAFKA